MEGNNTYTFSNWTHGATTNISNPYDLDHIRATSEKITKATLTSLSSLNVGEALVVGQATRFPVFIKVRERLTEETAFGTDFETTAKNFEGKRKG